MKVKTSELEGAALDWAVAKAAHPLSEVSGDRLRVMDTIEGDVCSIGSVWLGKPGNFTRTFQPSVDWSQGGPLIEKWRVMVEPLTHIDHPEAGWHAGFPSMIGVMHGPTALIAAMRAIVAAELGKEVEAPDELTEDDA